jgi:hypothetical protein
LTEDATVIPLAGREAYQPNMAAMARDQVRAAQESLGLDDEKFAEVLAPLLGYTPRAAAIRSWKTRVTPPGDVVIAAGIAAQAAGGADTLSRLQAARYAGITAAYASRSDFLADYPAADLLAGASLIRASGLALNMICQQYATSALRDSIEDGTEMRLLFLAPGSQAMLDREIEEDYPPGACDALTRLNMGILASQVRARLSPAAKGRLRIGVIADTLRFNILLIDGGTCVAQPYLPHARGLDSPTMMIRRTGGPVRGLHETFDSLFEQQWDRRETVC